MTFINKYQLSYKILVTHGIITHTHTHTYIYIYIQIFYPVQEENSFRVMNNASK